MSSGFSMPVSKLGMIRCTSEMMHGSQKLSDELAIDDYHLSKLPQWMNRSKPEREIHPQALGAEGCASSAKFPKDILFAFV
jgi:hypothetical protein